MSLVSPTNFQQPRVGHDAIQPSARTVAIISSLMSASEIARHLCDHGCENISDRLDMSSCSVYPISSGGFGDVYRCKLDDGTLVAIKTMRLQVNYSESSQKPLKHAARELYTWSKCQHPNVVRLLGLMELRGQIGMVSLWMENGNLPSYLAQHGDIDRSQLSIQISEGLAYLHHRNIIHGDLKGVNVLVSSEGTPLLADFGNAVLLERTLQFTRTTVKHSVSPRWTAPEVIEGSSTYSFAADVYALGMTILETFTGQVPYSEKNDIAVLFVVVARREHPKRPEGHIPLDSQHGDTLWSLLTRCWAYEAEARPRANKVVEVMKTITHEGLMHTQTAKQPPAPIQLGKPETPEESFYEFSLGALEPKPSISSVEAEAEEELYGFPTRWARSLLGEPQGGWNSWGALVNLACEGNNINSIGYIQATAHETISARTVPSGTHLDEPLPGGRTAEYQQEHDNYLVDRMRDHLAAIKWLERALSMCRQVPVHLIASHEKDMKRKVRQVKLPAWSKVLHRVWRIGRDKEIPDIPGKEHNEELPRNVVSAPGGGALQAQAHPHVWPRVYQRLLSWAMVWPLAELDKAFESTEGGYQVEEIALSVWCTQVYKRYVRARISESGGDASKVDRMYVPPNMADAISTAVYNGRHGDACQMLKDMWIPFGLEGMPKLIIVLARHRRHDHHWVTHNFSLPDGQLSTYDTFPGRSPPDERPLGWWFAIRSAWPHASYPSAHALVQKIVRISRPLQLPVDCSVAAAAIWRNLLMGQNANSSVDLERLRGMIGFEVNLLKQRKEMGRLTESDVKHDD